MLILRAAFKSSHFPLLVRPGVNSLAGRNKPIGGVSPFTFSAFACRPHTQEVPSFPKFHEYSTKPDMPIRVPLTPDNETARFHRHEYVPEVQPPHKPVIFTINEDPAVVSSEGSAILGNADAEVYIKQMNPDVPDMPKSEKVEF
ncbi:unnamed protein product [Tuber melanosporum]|jgi:hypothetical protein|uniref:(Perigord truffle) hypothetical protein n=1 Tax=Tuber melanosporum (strain Mel28) TaxID=656061 RepID=D5G8S3_TUBMM|nr:uncharacterized protein GSTUM_00003047001 [Tuber melanosporum]CAZ80916.1 unnamed protein product [Tuber melanosporum]